MHQFDLNLSGEPTIIVINDGWHILKHPYLVAYLEQWLKYLSDNNAIAIFTAEIAENEQKDSGLTKALNNEFATKIYLPTHKPELYKEFFNLSDEEYNIILSMDAINRHFLISYGDDSIIAELNLAGINFAIGILSNDPKAWKLINQIISEVNSDKPEKWLELFYQRYVNAL